MGEYVYNHAWEQARERLMALEEMMDPTTTGHLERLGISTGQRCLEIGPGAGSIAFWMSDQVGPAGQVVAVDLDPRLMDGHGRANLEVCTVDLRAAGIDGDGFDLAHARMVLEHIPERDVILRRMVDAIRPGGWLLVEDVDFGGPSLPMMARHFRPTEQADLYHAVWAAAGAVMTSAGADLSYGARVADELQSLGLVDVAASIHVAFCAGGPRNFIGLSVTQLGAAIVGGGLVSAMDLDRFLNLAGKTETTVPFAPLVSVWGRRPA